MSARQGQVDQRKAQPEAKSSCNRPCVEGEDGKVRVAKVGTHKCIISAQYINWIVCHSIEDFKFFN